MTTPQEPNVLRTSEIGKRLKEEWPDAYTTFSLNVDSHVGSPPKVRLQLYHADTHDWFDGWTLEECIEKVKAALAPKPEPSGAEVAIELDHPAEAEGD